MNVNELYKALSELQIRGYGECNVIYPYDDSDYEIKDVDVGCFNGVFIEVLIS